MFLSNDALNPAIIGGGVLPYTNRLKLPAIRSEPPPAGSVPPPMPPGVPYEFGSQWSVNAGEWRFVFEFALYGESAVTAIISVWRDETLANTRFLRLGLTLTRALLSVARPCAGGHGRWDGPRQALRPSAYLSGLTQYRSIKQLS